MCIVYCITNLTNNKRYIGWTNKTLDQRWKKSRLKCVGSEASFFVV